MKNIVTHLYHEIKAVLTDAARALTSSPPAPANYQRHALVGRGDYVAVAGVA